MPPRLSSAAATSKAKAASPGGQEKHAGLPAGANSPAWQGVHFTLPVPFDAEPAAHAKHGESVSGL